MVRECRNWGCIDMMKPPPVLATDCSAGDSQSQSTNRTLEKQQF